ncbi:MAG: OsmC family protein [Cytophagales bacterium]
MTHIVETQWMGKMQFNALINGHTIIMDAPPKVGGEDNGSIPKPFILSALAGCTGMDVIALLNKKGVKVENFDLKVEGETSKTQPIEYTSIKLDYIFEGDIESLDEVTEAVHLSQEKYCGVSSMLKKIIPLTWNIYFNNTLIYSKLSVPNIQVVDK